MTHESGRHDEGLAGSGHAGGAAGHEASKGSRTRRALRASIVGIACNVALSLMKGLTGLLAGSVAMVADAANNLSDAASSVVSLVGFKLASKPADAGHPFGHGRFEYIAGSIVAIMVIAVGLELIVSSIRKLLNPEPTDFGLLAIAVLVVSIAAKLGLSRYYHSVGREIGSQTLEATAVDARNDVIATASVLLAALVSRLTGFDLDGWAGLLVGLFIIVSGVGLVRDSANLLLGSAPDPELEERIRKTILSEPLALGLHDLMIHDYGPERRVASAHVEMPANLTVGEGHEVLDRIERTILESEGVEITLHLDPIMRDEAESGEVTP